MSLIHGMLIHVTLKLLISERKTQVQLPCDRVPRTERLGGILHLVRPHVVVSAGETRGYHHLSRHRLIERYRQLIQPPSPGMQITAVAIWEGLKAAGPDYQMSLNDVCVLMPAWFGVLASLFTGLLTYESSESHTAGIAAAAIMAVVPAHLQRSVGGGFDNESVAMTAMCATFYLWCRSLRDAGSWPVAVVAGGMFIIIICS